MRSCAAVIAAVCLCLLAGAPCASAAPTLPAGFELQTVASGLDAPVGVAWAPDGRMFIVEKDGLVKVRQNGVVRTILDMRADVNSYQDRGLLGVAVDKNFASNGYVYLLYVAENDPLVPDSGGRSISRLDRIQVNGASDVVSSPQRTTIVGTYQPSPTAFYCPQPHANDVDCIPADYYWHTIGTIRVDPADGTLWLGSGDANPTAGPESNDPATNVPPGSFRTYDEATYAGKIMHVTPQGQGVAGHPFCTGDSNPSHVCTKLYAKGFRNPFRFTLRGGGKGPVVGDVGWASQEELELTGAGKNYGWPCYEATGKPAYYWERPTCQDLYAQEGTAGAATPPNLRYDHTANGGSITGGPIFEGTNYPAAYRGRVYFADYANNWIRSAAVDASDTVSGATDFMTDAGYPVDLQVGPDGNLTYVDIGFGTINRIAYTTGNRAPIANGTASPTSGAAPLAVSFSSGGSSDPDNDPLSYSWSFGDGGTSTQANPTHTYTTSASFTAMLTVSDGDRTATKSFVITTSNTAPTPSISGQSTYRDGTQATLTGSATDPQDGTITDDSRFAWTVVQFHNTHTHSLSSGTGRNIQFTPTTDHDDNAHYVVTLRVTDSGGLQSETTKRLDPETIQLRLNSTPAGAHVDFGEKSGTMPFTTTTAIGYQTNVSAEASFVKDGETYTFDRWSNDKPRTHGIAVPSTDTTLTATYNGQPTALGTATPARTDAPAAVAFDGRASSDPDGDALAYDWDFGDGSAHGTTAQPSHTYAAAGTYTPRLTVSDGRPGGTHSVTLSAITITDAPPVPSVTAPAQYRVGEPMHVTGSATDRKDGTIPAGSLSWRVIRIDNNGTRTETGTGTGSSIDFTASNVNVTRTYEFELTAVDSGGHSATASRQVTPRVTDVRVLSSPAGAAVSWAGTSSFPVSSLAGFQADATAPVTWVKNGATYAFQRWSDGNAARTRAYKVPDSGATLTAEYALVPDDAPPTATIEAPADGSVFDAGERIDLSGTGSDDKGTPRLDWTVERHRGGTVTSVPVEGASFTVPGDAEPDDWYRVMLTATDSAGATDTDELRVDPHTSTVRLDSDPAGAPLSWDGASVTAPASALAVVGNPGSVGAAASFEREGRRWLFGSWSDGGAREHSVTVAAGDPLLTATFAQEPLPDLITPEQPQPQPEPGPQPQPQPQPGPLPHPQPQPAPKRPLRLSLPSRGLTLSSKGLASFKLVNPEASVWRGEVVLASASKVRVARGKSRRITFARGSLVVAGKAKRVVRLQLSPANRKLVAKLRRVRVTVTLTARGEKPLTPGVTVLLPPRR